MTGTRNYTCRTASLSFGPSLGLGTIEGRLENGTAFTCDWYYNSGTVFPLATGITTIQLRHASCDWYINTTTPENLPLPSAFSAVVACKTSGSSEQFGYSLDTTVPGAGAPLERQPRAGIRCRRPPPPPPPPSRQQQPPASSPSPSPKPAPVVAHPLCSVCAAGAGQRFGAMGEVQDHLHVRPLPLPLLGNAARFAAPGRLTAERAHPAPPSLLGPACRQWLLQLQVVHRRTVFCRNPSPRRGAMVPANYVVRTNTTGGLRPQQCDAPAGQWLTVPFSGAAQGYLCL